MAFIQPTTVPISFAGGLQNKTDALQLQPPSLLQLQNALFDKIGQLNKRPGYDILSNNIINGGSINAAVAIDNFNEELNLFDNLNIYTYLTAINAWASRGTAISLINTSSQIIRRDDAQQINPDGNVTQGIEVFAWEDSRGGVRYSVLDLATGAYPVSDQLLDGNAARPKVIRFNSLFYIFYNDGLNSLYFRIINPNNPNVIQSSIPVAADGVPTGFCYDVVAASDLYIIYPAQVVGGYNLQVVKMSSNNIPSAAITINTAPVANNSFINCLSAVRISTHDLWFSFGAANGHVRSFCTDDNLNLITTPAEGIEVDTGGGAIATITGIESLNLGSLQLVYEITGSTPSNQFIKTAIVNQNNTFTITGSLLSVGLASKPFSYNNNIFINLTYQSTLQSTYFTAFLTYQPFTIVGKIGASVGGGLRTNNMLPESPDLVSGQPGIYLFSNLTKGQYISEDNVSFSILGVNSTILDFTDTNKFNSVTYSNNLLFVGGILQSYDGISVVEQNYHLTPENITTEVLAGEGALSAGQYQYQVIYSWADKFGQIQMSGPCVPITVTTSQNAAVAVTVDTLRLTAKQGVLIRIYRTQVNETTFQEVTSQLAPFLNNPNVNSVTFVDTVADLDLAANGTLYTTGGVVPNIGPPSCSMITLYQDRVMIAGTEDASQIWFSKNKVNNSNYNTVPVEFSADLTIGVSQLGGAITALYIMDQNLIIFKESAILILNGEGPNDEGGGEVFPDPQIITKSVGCTNPNSILFTDAGLIFQTPKKGLWLLDRSLGEPSYIGAGVDDIALTNVVTSATQDQSRNLCIFTTLNGQAMVYDTVIQQWTTWTNHQAVDSISYNGDFCFAKSNGNVYLQNANNFYDGIISGQQIPYQMNVITPWISYSQILGYQAIFRLFILGTYKSPHNLNVSIGYNFDPAFTHQTIINATNTNTWGSDGYWGASSPWGGTWQPYIFQVNMPIQKCTSFRLQFNDIQVSPYLEAFAVSSLLFELGQMNSGVRLPLTNKVGPA